MHRYARKPDLHADDLKRYPAVRAFVLVGFPLLFHQPIKAAIPVRDLKVRSQFHRIGAFGRLPSDLLKWQ
jgi:hypothetical protein